MDVWGWRAESSGGLATQSKRWQKTQVFSSCKVCNRNEWISLHFVSLIQSWLRCMIGGGADGHFVTRLCASQNQEAILFIIPLILTAKSLKSTSPLVRVPKACFWQPHAPQLFSIVCLMDWEEEPLQAALTSAGPSASGNIPIIKEINVQN